MITVEEALNLVESNLLELETKSLLTHEALDHVLGTDVLSPIDMPPFDQSAMDGYAVHYSETIDSYQLIGEIPAGSSEQFDLEEGQAVRIFTGAAVPKSANTVVKQEIVEREGNTIQFTEEVRANQNIRPAGEQIRTGNLALKAGTHINPAAVGFLTGLGITTIEVHPSPKIAILATGDELVKAGQPLAYGKIYESNSYMLSAGLNHYGYRNHEIQSVADDYEETKRKIEAALDEHDVLMLSGGISVGDYDFVGKALTELGVDRIFYKVKQKPGKPIFFGKMNQKYIFALPGNPAAAMTSFYTYVLPALNFLSGKGFQGLKESRALLNEDYYSKGDRAVFLKAHCEKGTASILEGQSSAMLKSFAEANALIYIPADQEQVSKGSAVKVYLF